MGIWTATLLLAPPVAAQHPDDVYWDPAFGNPGANSRVRDILIDGNDVYFGGLFTQIGGIAAAGVARWDGQQWHTVGTAPRANVLAIYGGDLHAADSFVYRWNGTTWTTVIGFSEVTFSPAVTDLQEFHGDLYVSGGFRRIGSQEIHGLLRWDGGQWYEIPGEFWSYEDRWPVTFWGLAVGGPYLYVAGNFYAVEGVPTSGVARWDGTDWAPLDGTPRSGDFRTLDYHDGHLYLGGWPFGLNIWDGARWSSAGVNEMVLDGYGVSDQFYIAGNFTTISGRLMNGVGRFDGAQWTPLGSGLERYGWTFAVAARESGEIFAAGDFREAGGVTSHKIARWYNPVRYPTEPSPRHLATNQPASVTLEWTTSGPPNEPTGYDVYFGTVADPPLVAAGYAQTSYGPLELATATTYYWKVVSRDTQGNHATGPVWRFTTEDLVTSRLVVHSDSSYCGLVTSDTVRIDVMIEDCPDLDAGGFDLEFDPDKLTFLACEPGSLVAGWDVFECADRGAFLRIGGFTQTPVPAGTYGRLATLVFLSHCCGIDSSETTPLAPVNLTDDLVTMRPVAGSFHCDIYEGDGDANADGMVTSGDAFCTFESYLTYPSPTMEFCGPVGWDVRGDVDCSATITPADARCILAHWQSGECSFCNQVITGVRSPSAVGVAAVDIADMTRSRDDVIVTVTAGNIPEMTAFGFDVSYPADRMQFVTASRADLSDGLDGFAGVEVAPGVVRVGGFAGVPVPAAEPAPIVRLRFRRTAPLSGEIRIAGFVDDLGEARALARNLHPLERGAQSDRYVLFQNVPNPCNPVTAIRYSINAGAAPAPVRLSVYTVRGALVSRLVDESQGPGDYTVFWNGTDRRGSRVASGVYFYSLDVAGQRFTRKLVIIR